MLLLDGYGAGRTISTNFGLKNKVFSINLNIKIQSSVFYNSGVTRESLI